MKSCAAHVSDGHCCWVLIQLDLTHFVWTRIDDVPRTMNGIFGL